MIELRVTHRRHAENDTLNIRQEPSYNVIAYHCSIPFLNHLALWFDIYTWRCRDPKGLYAENDTLNIRQEPSYNVIAYHCSIPFLNHLALWLDIYTWRCRDPKGLSL